MKGNKILVVLIALAMLTTVLVVINRETVTAGKRIGQGHGYAPGYNYWGNASNTKTLVYSPKVDTRVTINTTGLKTNTDYFLFKPWYNNTGSGPSVLGWYSENDMIYKSTYIKIHTGAITQWQTAEFPDVVLDRSGLWLIDEDETHNMNDEASFASFIWVNSSIDYTITSPTESTEIAWGTNSTLTVTVDPGSSADTNIYTDLLFNGKLVNNDKGSTRYTHYYGNSRTIGIYGNITKGTTKVDGAVLGAGNYTIRAYKDLDGTTNYDYGTWGYNRTHNVTATGYNHTTCGPWDPPERNATDVTFRITPGTLQTTLPAANKTMYWNFPGEMDIAVKDSSGTNIYPTGFNILNRTGQNISSHLTVTRATGWINISSAAWGTPGTTWATNYTGMKIYLWVDTNGDVTTDAKRKWNEEWNSSAGGTDITFTIKAAPGTQFKWTDDDGSVGGVDVWGIGNTNNDGVIPYIPSITNVPLSIKFQIIGPDHVYFGATNPQEAMENITISGNAIFTGTLDKIPGVTSPFAGDAKTWIVPVIPTMSQNGGSIRLDYTWKTASKNYGTSYATLSIGGTKYYTNGTVVTVDTSEFYIDTPQTFTLTVKDADGASNKYGTAYLYYIGDTDGGTLGTPIVNGHISIDNGYDGYTLGFNTTQQRVNQTGAGNGHANFLNIKAPRNLTAYVVASVGTTTTYGYALVKMKPKNALKVHAEAIGAKTTLMSGYEYSKYYINTTIAGINATTYPKDESQMEIRIFDQSGKDVTDSLGTPTALDPFSTKIKEEFNIHLSDVYFTKSGTYTVYAHNYTATSEGNNGTLVIKPVAVTCDKSPLIWKHDNNISATFTILYEGQSVNGTLRIDNISSADPKYNRTWVNTSFDGSKDKNVGGWGNQSMEIDIVDGVITVNDITANYLPSGVSNKDITFWFKPTDGEYAKAEGIVKVTVPTAAPDKVHIPLTGTTKVVVSVTGRNNEKLGGVFVRLYGQGYDKNGTSVDGKVTFSVNPSSTGNISIDVGEAGRTISANIKVVDWTLVVSTDPLTQVDEGKEFTVTVKDKDTVLAVSGTDVTFNGKTETTDSTGTVTFTAPDVTSDSPLGITVTAEGYPEATASIKVIYVPTLIISSDESVVAGATFEIAVAKDTGDPVIGATVTFEGKTYKTKAGGVVTLTAPTTVGDYDITAAFGTFTPVTTTITVTKKTGGIPGFELVTLIVAIGVALILLRRRRN